MEEIKILDFGYINSIGESTGTIRIPGEEGTFVFLADKLSREITLRVGQSVQFSKHESPEVEFLAQDIEPIDL